MAPTEEMCGISVVVNKDNNVVPESLITAMNLRVKHRGPDGEGYFFGESFAFGHRRLSIIDLSEGGHQPMQRDEDWLVFNGMVYNFVELKEELEVSGHHFDSHCDTEVLLAACRQWGVAAFDKLNGMWAFAWFRKETNDIILCRDRYGIKPLYYTDLKTVFAAGSEIKQFLDLPGFSADLNKKSALNFLTNGHLNYSDNTFFDGVRELRPGCYLVYNLSSHSKNIVQWYNLDKSSKIQNVGWEEASEKVRWLFNDSMRIRMRADVKIGSCLSGGMDSSAIVSNIHRQKLAPDDFITITSCFDVKEYDEREYSNVVNDATGFRSVKTFPQLQDLLDKGEMDDMLYYQDQPFSTASHYSEHEVFKTARNEGLKVMLDGQGADEYICGYNEFYTAYLNELLRTGKMTEFWDNLKSKAHQKQLSLTSYIIHYFKGAFFHRIVKFGKKVLGKEDFPWLKRSWIIAAKSDLISFEDKSIRQLSLQEVGHTSLPMQLHSEDRNSMMHAIESRLPFLDHRLVEFIIGLPDHYKIKDGFSKYIIRETIDEIPEKVRYRKDKMGFVAPDEPWIRANKVQIREELKKAVENTDIFSEELLQRFDRFIDKKTGFEPIYFRAIALNRFLKVFSMNINLFLFFKLAFFEFSNN